MSLPTITDYQKCVEHFEKSRRRFYNLRKDPENNHNQITKSIQYFNSRIRYYKSKIRLLRDDY